MELLGKVTESTLNVQAHLSPFSRPAESYQAPGLEGSVSASASSCPLTFAIAAKPCESRVTVSWGSQPASPSSLKSRQTELEYRRRYYSCDRRSSWRGRVEYQYTPHSSRCRRGRER